MEPNTDSNTGLDLAREGTRDITVETTYREMAVPVVFQPFSQTSIEVHTSSPATLLALLTTPPTISPICI